MDNARLKHDVALMSAEHCGEALRGLLSKEQLRAMTEQFYHICHAGIEAFCVYQERIDHRLSPTKN